MTVITIMSERVFHCHILTTEVNICEQGKEWGTKMEQTKVDFSRVGDWQ